MEGAGHPLRRSEIGLCLSGGGYRAMLFHLGALYRLNESGWLPRLSRVASVSGGSITAGVLGSRWNSLDFDASGSAARFEELVAHPLLTVAQTTVDVGAIIGGFPPGRSSRRVQRAYDDLLFHGATLQALPDPASGPEFILLATDLTTGTLVQMSRSAFGSYRSPRQANPTIALSQAVAASSAFPPFLSPCVVDLPNRERLYLTDGGVYDNLALEPVLKRCTVVLASDGGGPFSEPKRPRLGPLLGTLRVLNVVDVQVRRLRRRSLIAAYKTGNTHGALWTIGTDPRAYSAENPQLPCPPERVTALALTPTRLARMDTRTCHQLVNWGFASAENSLRSNGMAEIGVAHAFPFAGGLG